MTYRSFLPPGLCTLNGKRYVVPGYYEVPMNTTLEEVYANWEKVEPKPAPGKGCTTEEIDAYLAGTWTPEMINRDAPDMHETVESSRTGEEYDVVRVNGEWSCSCKGFGFRRNCKHVKMVKLKHD